MIPEEGVYCVADGCRNLATTELPVGVTRDGELIVELVCELHGPNEEATP